MGTDVSVRTAFRVKQQPHPQRAVPAACHFRVQGLPDGIEIT